VSVILYDKLAAWAAGKPQIAALHIFGSRARGDHRPDSDLNVALEFVDVERQVIELVYNRARWIWELSELSGLTVNDLDLRFDKHIVKLPIVTVYRRTTP
jgi:predicted nucleotidyltransferase